MHVPWSSLVVSSLQSAFVHRDNSDGTIDSICRHCLSTIATSMWEKELECAEYSHLCDPYRLEYLHKLAEDSPSPQNGAANHS